MRLVLRSKIHNALVTEANINYIGSITIDGRNYKVDPNVTVTTTSLKLVAPYPQDSGSSLSYKIMETSTLINPRITSVVNIFVEGVEKKLSNFEPRQKL